MIKELKEGQVVVMDNASFHTSQRTVDLIEFVGCKVQFLPAYSPDLKPIERFWAKMKRWIKNKISDYTQIHLVIDEFFKTHNAT